MKHSTNQNVKNNFFNKSLQYIRLYEYAEECSNFFSKIRLSLSQTTNDEPPQDVNVWQHPRIVKNIFNNIRCKPKKRKGVKVYRIEHDKAGLVTTAENRLSYRQFIDRKDYFAVKRIQLVIKTLPYQLSFSHHFGVIDRLRASNGKLLNDKATIHELSIFIRGFWVIKYQDNHTEKLVKLPSYHGQHLITHELCESSKHVTLEYRKEISSPNNTYDDRYIAYLKYILQQERDIFLKIIQKSTLYNLNGLVMDKDLLKTCHKNQNEYRRIKDQTPDEY